MTSLHYGQHNRKTEAMQEKNPCIQCVRVVARKALHWEVIPLLCFLILSQAVSSIDDFLLLPFAVC